MNFTDFTSRKQSRKREISMFQYNWHALLSPWFVAGSPCSSFPNLRTPCSLYFHKKKQTLFLWRERPQDLISTMAFWKMSILPETFWHFRFICLNNLFQQCSVSRLFFMDILRPSVRVVICVLTVYFIYLSVAGPDLQWRAGGRGSSRPWDNRGVSFRSKNMDPPLLISQYSGP